MNFGNTSNIGFIELLFVLLAWGVPIAVLVWFVRTLTSMSVSLREIADRLSDLERTVRETSRGGI
jgi:hypothetical protein